MTAKDREFDRVHNQLLQTIAAKYDNVTEIDKISAVSKKVESVKLVMQDNIDLALQNCVKLESIEKAAGTRSSSALISGILLICILEELQQQAGVFKKNANELKKKMWWKNMKASSSSFE